MSRYHIDGTVIDANLTLADVSSAAQSHYSMDSILVGQVVFEMPIDDQRNLSKRHVEYDVLVNEGMAQVLYRNVRMIDSFGGINNFNEVVLQDTVNKSSAEKDTPSIKSGAMVLVACVNGNKDRSVIIGTIQHPAIRLGDIKNRISQFSGESASRTTTVKELPTLLPGASKADGSRILGEFQGLRWNVNKDGELTIVYQGPKDDAGKLTASTTQPTILKFTKDGEFFVVDNLDQEIKISRVDKVISLNSGNGDKIEINRDSNTITLSAASKIVEESDGDMSQSVASDMDTVVGGDWNITVTGNVNVTGTQISLNGVAMGDVLTTITSPVVDSIFGAPSVGVPTVKAG